MGPNNKQPILYSKSKNTENTSTETAEGSCFWVEWGTGTYRGYDKVPYLDLGNELFFVNTY